MTLSLGSSTTATDLGASTNASDWRHIRLTDNTSVYVYIDAAGDFDVEARVVTTSGDTISAVGALTEMVNVSDIASADHFRIAALSTTQFIVVFRAASASGAIKAVAATVSGTTITAGSVATIESTGSTVNSQADFWVCSVDNAGKAIVCYQDRNDASKLTAKAFDVTGTSIGTPGSGHQFNTTGGGALACDAFGDGAHVICGYLESGDIKASVLNVSGTTVTSGTVFSVDTANTYSSANGVRVIGIGSTEAAVIYTQVSPSASEAIFVELVTRSGTTLSDGSSSTFFGETTGGGIPMDGVHLSGGQLVIVYYEGDTGQAVEAIEIGLSNGIPASKGTPLTLDASPSDITNVGLAKVEVNKMSVIYDADKVAVLSTTLVSAANAFRFLGVTVDNENLYVAGLKDESTLKLFDYDLATLTENGTASFGAATDADIDAQTRGIFPVIRPASDEILYLYGRDGNNVQVQYNDRNGTLGWTDIGPGTATWGSAKMATGLFPAPMRPDDVIVVFRDNDVYRTLFGTSNWAKMGDMTEEITVAERHSTRRNEILYAGTAAGTAYYTHNYGVSDSDAGGTVMGTINNFFLMR